MKQLSTLQLLLRIVPSFYIGLEPSALTPLLFDALLFAVDVLTVFLGRLACTQCLQEVKFYCC